MPCEKPSQPALQLLSIPTSKPGMKALLGGTDQDPQEGLKIPQLKGLLPTFNLEC